ncbi:UvrD-helicase domain-containing protein [Polyangium mundeleinium]|uniref:DNA 3'-5' helicase n=1 Tax=Polyangium mundeleinium TaxID=2995306 RepID=A0ABT5EFV8_9BACT|nr:UvrD-helicase domain-containing protein [Polyangium mundeleinium]MDC0739767.1 UvrD-helicase domain-containing protein [Polyangium mundeleinium]
MTEGALAFEALQGEGLADAEARALIRGALGSTMIVEAAAGTGKTTELVLRMVAVLAEGRAEIEEIVAVTFTEKAAGELKLRLRSGIERARRLAPDEAQRANLERALAHLEEARISTIHGFCADLLRERPVEAGVDPAFRVVTEAEADRRYGEAFHRWLEQILGRPPEGVRRLLRRREHGPGPIERLRRAGQELIAWRHFTARWQRPPFDRDRAVDAILAEMSAFAEASEGALHGNDPLHRDTEPARALVMRLRAEGEHRWDRDEIEAELCALSRQRDFMRPRRGAGSRYGAHTTRADLLAAHAALVASLERFQRAADGDLAALLQEELGALVATYQARKAEVGALDFEDLLVCTRDLVRDQGEVRRAFQERYRCIFVDEFQDTDPLQAEILMLLAADDPSVRAYRDVRPVPGKLFLVGDPKQAIYRFRRADLSVYEEVKELLVRRGALFVELCTSFRSVPAIQKLVNAAFAPVMVGDREALSARYVPLRPARKAIAEQPAIVCVPVPEPYGKQRLTSAAVEASVPAAVGAYLDWLLHESGWKVTERDQPGGLVPVAPRHVCLVFRRFESHGEDVTRAYVEALEARGIPHVLVGGKSFYAREEVETMLAALRAIERPEDELAVFATLRGSLFAVGDEALLEYRFTYGKLHPQRIPEAPLPPHLAPIAAALSLLAQLSEGRNARPIETTVTELCDATRACVGFALRPSGERALANVLHIAELGRAYEASGGTSFRAFVEQLEEDAERGRAPEAPILEEGGDGVRIMTAHRAKGLEFPVVVLADVTARLGAQAVSRYVDASRSLCALRLGSVAPLDLVEHEALEMRRDEAEGTRLVYVAATRARDLVIVPAVGDDPRFPEQSWIGPIHAAIAPPSGAMPSADAAPGCPPFGDDTVLSRPPGISRGPATVCPGEYSLPGGHDVVWWDVTRLDLAREPAFGVRREDMLRKDAPVGRVEEDLETYRRWVRERAADRERGARPLYKVQTVTERAETSNEAPGLDVPIVDVGREAGRPGGARFGELVHAVLAQIPLSADRDVVEQAAALAARLFGATEIEEAAAVRAVVLALAHPVIERARAAEARGECRRETPLSLMAEDGTLIEGIVDLAFREPNGWTVVDFKTDREIDRAGPVYRRQVSLYATAIGRATGEACTALLLRV